MQRGISFLAALIIVAGLTCASASPFTFQGRLNDASGVASGPHDFRFRLYDSASAGTQIGAELEGAAVNVDGGLFSVLLDFGPDAFNGDARWLEIDVQAGGGGYATLTPRQVLSATPYAMHSAVASDLAGTAHVLVQTTASATANAANLLAAYAKARTLTPNGQPLSATNRAVVLVAPGKYDLGTTQVHLDTEFVDLVGLSSNRDNQYLFRADTTIPYGTGVLRQTADNVRIANLTVAISGESGMPSSSSPAAYFPDSTTSNTVVANCAFLGNGTRLPTRYGVEYRGCYTDCRCVGGYAFGAYGVASGTFTNCSGELFAFARTGTASGTFTNCTGTASAFGGGGGTASGVFTNCTAGDLSFAAGGTASGTFTNCTGLFRAFGGSGGTASGKFVNCTGGNNSFGGGSSGGGASGTFTNCTGGDAAFGGRYANASGTFTNCTGGNNAFGGTPSGLAGGTFTNCSGGTGCFGGASAGTGKFYYCKAGTGSFTTTESVRLLCIEADVLLPDYP